MSENKAVDKKDGRLKRYQSLAAMRTAHAKLVQKRREKGVTPEFLAQVTTFIMRGKGIGALLDSVKDRQAGQSLLDYWENVLNKKGQESIDPTLEEFDPTLAPEIPDELCPYLGLDAFREGNQNIFFGRQRLVNQLVQQLQTRRLLAVVGPSGSGKSSVVLAGLLPLLRNGALPESENWHYLPAMVPGSRPLMNLAQILQPVDSRFNWTARQPGLFRENSAHLLQLLPTKDADTPVVLTIDQFEEIFTLCQDDEARHAFVNNLIQFAQDGRSRHIIILTMRTDFESHIARLPSFQPLFDDALMPVTSLNASELRDAIERPAELVGLKFEEGVIDALLKDILGEPAALPLLQFTLLKLWELRQRNRVTWEAYRQLEGGRHALANSADALYDSLIPEDQRTLKNILLRMVRPGAGLEVTSNRVRQTDLFTAGEAQDRVARVLQRLVDARLLRLTEGDSPDNVQVEVAHEALVRNWPRLVDWLEDERENIRRRLRLTTAAEQWELLDRDESVLFRGVVLAEALSFSNLNPLEAEFIAACQAAVVREEEEKRAVRERELAQARKLFETERQRVQEREQANRWLSRLVIALAALVIISFITAGLAIRNGNIAGENAALAEEARQQEADARATAVFSAHEAAENAATAVAAQQQEAIARATSDANALIADQAREEEAAARATAVASAGVAAAEAAEAEAARAQAEAAQKEAEQRTQEVIARTLAGNAIEQQDSNPELSLLLALEAVNVALVNDDLVPTVAEETLYRVLQAFQLKRTFSGHSDWVSDVAFSPDGSRLATTSLDRTAKIWDVTNGQELFAFEEHSRAVISVAFSPDGKILATGSENGFIILWNTETGAKINVLGSSLVAVHTVTFRPDGSRLAAAYDDGTVRIWNIRNYNSEFVLTRHAGAVNDVTYSPDGTQFATVGEDGRIIVWRSDNGAQLYSIEAELDENSNPLIINAITFSADGDQLITGNADGTVKVWNAVSGEFLIKLPGHTSFVADIAVSADGKRLATSSGDGTAKVWDTETWQTLNTLLGHEGVVSAVAFDPGSQFLATASQDRLAKVWSVENVLSPLILAGHQNVVNRLAFHPDSTMIATAGGDQSVRLWDTANGQLLFDFDQHNGAVNDVAFTPDGSLLAAASDDFNAWIWDVETGESLITLGNHLGPVTAVSFSPDGVYLATAGDDGFVRVWDRESWTLRYELSHRDFIEEDSVSVRTVAFHPNSTLLLSGDDQGNVIFWDVAAETAVRQIVAHEETAVNDIAISPDGTRFATAGNDGVVRLWSFNEDEPPTTLTGHSGAVWSVTFYQDGNRVATASADGTVKLWDSATNQLLRTLVGHRAPVTDVAISADGLRVATSSTDRTAQINDLDTVQELFEKANRLVTRSLTEEECKLYMPDSECPTVFSSTP